MPQEEFPEERRMKYAEMVHRGLDLLIERNAKLVLLPSNTTGLLVITKDNVGKIPFRQQKDRLRSFLKADLPEFVQLMDYELPSYEAFQRQHSTFYTNPGAAKASGIPDWTLTSQIVGDHTRDWRLDYEIWKGVASSLFSFVRDTLGWSLLVPLSSRDDLDRQLNRLIKTISEEYNPAYTLAQEELDMWFQGARASDAKDYDAVIRATTTHIDRMYEAFGRDWQKVATTLMTVQRLYVDAIATEGGFVHMWEDIKDIFVTVLAENQHITPTLITEKFNKSAAVARSTRIREHQANYLRHVPTDGLFSAAPAERLVVREQVTQAVHAVTPNYGNSSINC